MVSALCTLEEARLALRLQATDTRDDSRIQQAIDIVSAAMHRHLAREYVLNEAGTSVTEYHDGEGRSEIELEEWPIQSVASVHDSPDRSYGAGDLLTANTDYLVESTQHGARIRLLPQGEAFSVLRGTETSTFFAGVANVRVVYVPGYATRAALPRDLVGVCITETVALLAKQPNAGLTRLQAGDLSQDFDGEAWRPESLRTLARYRRLL